MDFAFHYAAGTRQVDDTRFKVVEASTMVGISVKNASKLWIFQMLRWCCLRKMLRECVVEVRRLFLFWWRGRREVAGKKTSSLLAKNLQTLGYKNKTCTFIPIIHSRERLVTILNNLN